MIPSDMQQGTVHSTNNCGKLIINKYINSLNVNVTFLDTGYKTKSQSCSIRNGTVKDKLHPSVYGVGYLGIGKHKSVVNGRKTKIYKTWGRMLERCYDIKKQERFPTYIGCAVCEEWHNFQNFADWMSEQDYRGKELDKDIKVKGNKVYGPDTCMFVTALENRVESSAKEYTFISPIGEVVNACNLRGFCRNQNLTLRSMQYVNSGKLNHHKGWTKHED